MNMKRKKIIVAVAVIACCQMVVAQQRNVIPLEYVSEFSMGTNKNTGAFTSSYRNDSCGWYTPNQAFDLVPPGYHVPYESEMGVILPNYIETYTNRNAENVGFVYKSRTFMNHPEDVMIAGENGSYTADYLFNADRPTVLYGIRFKGKGDIYRSAYRYEKVGNLNGESRSSWGNRKSYLLVQARYLGPNSTVSLDDVASEDFWKASDIVTRIIPANGKHSLRDDNWFDTQIGSMISLLAQTSTTPVNMNVFEISGSGLYFVSKRGASHENFVYGGDAVVRPFINKLPEKPIYNPHPVVHKPYMATVAKRPNLPIDYIADFNVGTKPKAPNIKEGANGSKLNLGTYKDKMPPGYHIPSNYEWNGIFPNGLMGQNDDVNWRTKEMITVNGKTREFTAQYLYIWQKKGLYLGYGLKFQDNTNEYLSAYKYEFDLQTYNMKVSCRYLGPQFDGEIQELTSPEFWTTNDVKTIYLPVNNMPFPSFVDVFGNYQIIKNGTQTVFTMTSSSMGWSRLHYDADSFVRPFKNSLKAPAATAKGRPAAQKSASPRNKRR